MSDVDKKATVASAGGQRETMSDDLQLVDDVWGGTRTMRKAATRHLPQEPGESSQAYRNRLARSTFFNAYKRAVKTLKGKPFSKPITMSDKLNSKFEMLTNDVDMTGRHLDVFAVDTFERALRDGMTFFLVDYPDTSSAQNLAEEQEMKARPYFVDIDVRDFIAAAFSVVNGQYVLQQFRYFETATESDGPWGEKQITQVRVLEQGAWTIFRQKKDVAGMTPMSETDANTWVPFEQGTNSLKEIPLVAVYTNRQGYLCAEPPLLDLLFLNIEHWQSSSDQRNILHVARTPILFGRGLGQTTADGEAKTIVISANAMVTSESEHGDLKYVEHEGKAIGAGKEDIESIENRMSVMGTQALVKRTPQAGIGKTATQTSADQEADYCDLAVMVRMLEDALEQGYNFAGQYLDTEAPNERFITINKDFGISQGDYQLANFLLAARAAGEISQITFLNELRRYGILDPTIEVNDEIERISLEPPKGVTIPGFGSLDFAARLPPVPGQQPPAPKPNEVKPEGVPVGNQA